MTNNEPQAPDLPGIEHRYLLITHIPHRVHPDGSVWLDRLWHRDLAEHLTYLRRFTLASPRIPWREDEGWVRLSVPPGAEFRTAELPAFDSFGRALLALPATALALWRAIGEADIVHSGIAGWPVALGWIADPIALLRGRKLVIVIESATWRLTGRAHPSWKDRLRAVATESLGRFFVNRADLLLVTQPAYRRTLFTNGRGAAYVTPAIWINPEDVLDATHARGSWDRKTGPSAAEARFLFAGRLVPEKGIDVLLDAARSLERSGERVRIDIIGEGPRREACRAVAEELRSVKMSVLPEVPYGPEFFALLRSYHALVVPSLSDEQPRIVFDAFAQAVPVLAARTDGLTPHVVAGVTGRLFEPRSAESLAGAMSAAAKDLEGLRALGLGALAAARGATHREMHRTRWRILLECFGPT